jgi:hypothetical protein
MFEGKSKPIKIESKKIFLRQELDLDESLPTVLMVGGGDGMGGIVCKYVYALCCCRWKNLLLTKTL